MNILVVTQYFHPEPFRINDLVAGLCQRGHNVTVLTGMPNYPDGRFYRGYAWHGPATGTYAGARVVRVPLISRGRAKNWRLALNYLSFALFASLLGPLRCRGSYDLIFVFQPSPVSVGLPALLLGRIKRAPVMLWVQDLWPDTLAAVGQGRVANRVGGWLADFIHRRCDLLLIQSRAFAPRLAARGIMQTAVRYLPNWAEDLYASAASVHTDSQLATLPGFKILFAGNLGSAQSLETIMDAAERLKERRDIRWLFVGDGLMRAWIEQQVQSRGLLETVFLFGRHPVESMPAFFAGADALLVTLRADPVFTLTIPSKLQSYLAAGRPVLGALNGEGARIIAEAGAGLAAAAEDAAGLASCAERLAALPENQRMEMGRLGRAYFETHFRRDFLLGQLETWMQELKGTRDAHTDTGR